MFFVLGRDVESVYRFEKALVSFLFACALFPFQLAAFIQAPQNNPDNQRDNNTRRWDDDLQPVFHMHRSYFAFGLFILTQHSRNCPAPRPRYSVVPTSGLYTLHKGAVLQHPGPGRAFKGLGGAKRYCRRDSIGDRFAQGAMTKYWVFPQGGAWRNLKPTGKPLHP